MDGKLREYDTFIHESTLIYVCGTRFRIETTNDYIMDWTFKYLKAEWEKVEPKHELDEWEKETCQRLLAKGYKWIARDEEEENEDAILCAYSKKPKKDTCYVGWGSCGEYTEIFDGFDFVQWEDAEPTSMPWLLEDK